MSLPAKPDVHYRAIVWKVDDPFILPEQVVYVRTFYDAYRDITLVVVEGRGLPPWWRGAHPYEFEDLAALRRYLTAQGR